MPCWNGDIVVELVECWPNVFWSREFDPQPCTNWAWGHRTAVPALPREEMGGSEVKGHSLPRQRSLRLGWDALSPVSKQNNSNEIPNTTKSLFLILEQIGVGAIELFLLVTGISLSDPVLCLSVFTHIYLYLLFLRIAVSKCVGGFVTSWCFLIFLINLATFNTFLIFVP